jgi:hypothetical protein
MVAQLAEPGKPLDVTNWPTDLQQKFKSAIFQEADTTIVTPHIGDMPLLASKDIGKIILQFKSFSIAANHRLMMTAVDDFTAQKAIGLMAMVFFGHVSHMAKLAIADKEAPTDTDTLLHEAIARSGIFAMWSEINAILERASSGKASMYNLMGLDTKEALTYNQNLSLVDMIWGPTAKSMNNAKHIVTAMVSGDWRESDVRAIRRELWLNNWWGTYRLFNHMEDSMIERMVR